MRSPEAFQTMRLAVEDWHAPAPSGSAKKTLSAELAPVLTHEVLAPLPPSFQFDDRQDTFGKIEDWIAARDKESSVMAIRNRDTRALLGLLILAFFNPEKTSGLEKETTGTLHIGYLLAKSAWGHGYASELIAGLVTSLRTTKSGVRILAGVSQDNRASARVLEKNGFVETGAQAESGMRTFALDLRAPVRAEDANKCA